MNKFEKYLKIIVFIIGTIIILSVAFSGCDVIKCYPTYKPDGTYIGFQCGGEF